MAWYLDTVRIFPQTSNKSTEQLIAELNPLAGGSIYHNFGYSEEKRALNFYVVGLTDEAAIQNMTTLGTTVTLSGPYGANDYLVKSISSDISSWYCQSLRPDLPSTDPVFIVDAELWLDE